MATRLEAFERHYTWVAAVGLRLFQPAADAGAARFRRGRSSSRSTIARRRELQERAVRALVFKCDVLWAMLDAIHGKYAAGCNRSHERDPKPARAGAGRALANGRGHGEPVLLYPGRRR